MAPGFFLRPLLGRPRILRESWPKTRLLRPPTLPREGVKGKSFLWRDNGSLERGPRAPGLAGSTRGTAGILATAYRPLPCCKPQFSDPFSCSTGCLSSKQMQPGHRCDCAGLTLRRGRGRGGA